jgi:hypothetical protein
MASADQAVSSALRISRVLEQIDYRLAQTEADKEAIYRLRYNAYLKEGAIQPNPHHRVTDRFDDMPNSWTFGIYSDGELASSLRISVGSAQFPETPSMDVFPDLLKPEIDSGKVLVDPTRFVANSLVARRIPELPYLTVRLAYVACAHFNADLGLATVRSEHQAFYRRVFLHQPLCAPRPYPTLTKPLSLMAVNFREMREKVFSRYPYFQSTFFERRMLFERNMLASPALSGPELVPDLHMPRAEIAG